MSDFEDALEGVIDAGILKRVVDSSDRPLARYVALDDRKRELEAELRDVKRQKAEMQSELEELFVYHGTSSMRDSVSGKLVWLQRRVWARTARDGDETTPEEQARASNALRAAGLGDFVDVRPGVQRLSKHFRELRVEREEGGEPVTDVADLLPDALRGSIDLVEDTYLSVRES